jgi:hypothetical protein
MVFIKIIHTGFLAAILCAQTDSNVLRLGGFFLVKNFLDPKLCRWAAGILRQWIKFNRRRFVLSARCRQHDESQSKEKDRRLPAGLGIV